MKKNYIQPIVEAVEVKAASLMQAASPNVNMTGGSGIDPD